LSESDSVSENEVFTDDDLQLDEELNEEDEESRRTSWKNQKYIPNKKRFIILSIVFSVIQLTALLLFAFVFKDDQGRGLYDLGIFIICPAIGLSVSYLSPVHHCIPQEERYQNPGIESLASLSGALTHS